MTTYRTILVPIDFSDASAAALDAAKELAKTFGARLHLLHCYPVHPLLRGYETPVSDGFERDLRHAAQQRLDEWSQKVSAAGQPVTEHLSPYAPGEAIAEKAEEIGADLSVMGTRGLTGLKHVWLGSVAERTIQIAPCPVLTVKETDG